jgi:hypothetical protein
VSPPIHPSRRNFRLLIALALGFCLSGCSWLKSLKTTEEDPAFPGWSNKMSSGVRAQGKEKEAKPSGLLFDKRSQEIEKNLGGGY